MLLFACQGLSQVVPTISQADPDSFNSKSWKFNLVVDGFLMPKHTSYASPDFIADEPGCASKALQPGSASCDLSGACLQAMRIDTRENQCISRAPHASDETAV